MEGQSDRLTDDRITPTDDHTTCSSTIV